MKKITIILAITLTFLSCNDYKNQKSGNGNVATESRNVSENFTKIVANKAINVQLEQSNVNEIEVEADSNLLKHITTIIDNGVLKISSDINIQNAEKMLVKVKMKRINEIETTSAASVKGINIFKGKSLRIAASSSSEIDVEAEFENISIETTSTGEVNIKGKTLKLETRSSSASDINATDLLANEVYAQATSASKTKVHAIVKLDAKASSASSIIAVNKPKEVRKEVTSAASVSTE